MLIAFGGLKGSGKDTAGQLMVEEYGFTQIAFADALREALLILDPVVWSDSDEVGVSVKLSEVVFAFGWDYCKRTYPEVRRLMQVFGTEVGRLLFGENVWVDILAKRFPDISSEESRYVITDCRFKNEVDFVHGNYGDLCWIERPGITSDGHASENTDIKDYSDYQFTNDTDLIEFEEDIRFFLFMKGVEPIER